MPQKTAKCTHSSLEDGALCRCPIFVPRPNAGEDEANICDGCRHTIAFHIDLATPSSEDTSAKLEEILASYSAQAASFGTSGPESPSKASGSTRSGASSSKPRPLSKASESDARKEAVASLKRSYDSDDDVKGSAPKGKKKKRGASKKAFTEIRLIAILPHGLDADGYLNQTSEASPLQIDKLIELGFAKIGSRGILKFGNEWDTQMLDDWLRETLPIAFDQIEAVPGALDDEYPWRLLKSSRSHLELHRERPDGYDAMSAKGKNKGWQDSKLFFVTRLPIPSVIDVLDTSVPSHKGKGKAVRKRPISK
ncbi:hypothetical protein K439DRAFT_1624706 [Ramaria rubella]|nr:hypothetical protein K439DRAFT_1624706 [Ramaria rubella]